MPKKFYGYDYEPRRKANEKYLREKVDSITVRVKKGKKADLIALAEKNQLSLNATISKILDYGLDHPDILEH